MHKGVPSRLCVTVVPWLLVVLSQQIGKNTGIKRSTQIDVALLHQFAQNQSIPAETSVSINQTCHICCCCSMSFVLTLSTAHTIVLHSIVGHTHHTVLGHSYHSTVLGSSLLAVTLRRILAFGIKVPLRPMLFSYSYQGRF